VARSIRSEPGYNVSPFESADPIVHNRVFGIARFDLSTRHVDFTPISPSPTGMSGLQITPDKKKAYTVTGTSVASSGPSILLTTRGR